MSKQDDLILEAEDALAIAQAGVYALSGITAGTKMALEGLVDATGALLSLVRLQALVAVKPAPSAKRKAPRG